MNYFSVNMSNMTKKILFLFSEPDLGSTPADPLRPPHPLQAGDPGGGGRHLDQLRHHKHRWVDLVGKEGGLKNGRAPCRN